MNVLREAFRDFTFPCAHNYFTCGGTDWFENYKIRCRTTSDVKNRLSSPAFQSKTKKEKETSIQHKALPNAEVNVLPQDNNVNVVAVVVVVCLFIA